MTLNSLVATYEREKRAKDKARSEMWDWFRDQTAPEVSATDIAIAEAFRAEAPPSIATVSKTLGLKDIGRITAIRKSVRKEQQIEADKKALLGEVSEW